MSNLTEAQYAKIDADDKADSDYANWKLNMRLEQEEAIREYVER